MAAAVCNTSVCRLLRFAFVMILLLHYVTSAKKKAVSKKDSTVKLEGKVKQLLDWNLRKPIINLNGDKFREYVKSSPRNYSIIVMFTALQPQRQCQVCRQGHEEYEIVASSWRSSSDYSSRVFFTMVDFDEGPDVFQAMKLNSAPLFVHFPPTGKRKAQDTMDLQRTGLGAESIAKFVQDRSGVPIRVIRPPNYTVPIVMLLALGTIGLLAYFTRIDISFLYSTTNWGYAALCIIFAMSSGQMWNQIRGPPLFHKNPQTGETAYIHGSSQYQFISESYIIMALHGAITFGWILLFETAPGSRGSSKKTTAILGLVLVVGVFSLLLYIFRSKYPGYPYRFLL
ncbi:magnesium transporter protein 1-like [Corticium candelabrum]|uniref:magnesium transporter protein 1-like n=1 Tax=Corticium candelabrum TaxID=121492 RepID=UPI002E276681|nr:magnesium transporter protein 1-like [Corticium candelabrum]